MDDSSVTVRARWLVVVGVVVLVAGIVGGVVWVRRARPEAAPATVVLQAATDPGVDSFVPVVSSRPVAVVLPPSGTAAGVTATVDPDSGMRMVSGTADRLYAGARPGNPELYGGSGSLSACDPAAIASFLAAHPDKAAAWAGVRGIGADAIAGYLGSLTPVVLVHDTVVTNHGFAGGAATAFVSVLQAGTAVLVDATGLPVVRCACGNPLSAPPRVDLSGADVQGARWDGYDPGAAVTVVPGSAVAQFVVVDVVSGQDVTVTAGPAAALSTVGAASTSSTPTTSGDSACVLDLTWPVPSPGWVEAPDGGLTCQQMIDLWRRYEQWPGERGGSAQWVSFDDGWSCTTRLASETTSIVGRCGQDSGGRFVVHQGPVGVLTTVPTTSGPTTTGPTSTAPPANAPTTAPSTTGPSSAAAPVTPTTSANGYQAFLTPSQNIRCYLQGGNFSCSEDQYDFALPEHCENGSHVPVLHMKTTGPAALSSCRGDDFAGVHSWPDPTPYGTTVQLDGISCDVQQTGVRCTNLDGHGFTLSRAANTVF